MWLEDVFAVSRPTLYSLSKRVLERPEVASPDALPDKQAKAVHQIEVNATRLQRAVLTAAFPVKIVLQPLQELLAEAFHFAFCLWLFLHKGMAQTSCAIRSDVSTVRKHGANTIVALHDTLAG